MATTTKEKRKRFTTPRGIARYPRLNSPDTKFNPEGDYKVDLVVKTSLVEELIQEIDKAFAAQMTETKSDPKNKGKKIKEADLPYRLNPDNEEETILKFKCKASFTDKKTGQVKPLRPGLFDKYGKEFPLETIVGGGSVIRVSFEMIPFFVAAVGVGVSLRLSAVQVIELKEYTGGGDAKSYGFEDEGDEGAVGEEASTSTGAAASGEADF
jgi:hypothetical protein